jgi:hydrogenase maturation protease
MPRISVIGIGSAFGDDRAGWRVAELLAGSSQSFVNPEGVTITACRSPGSELPGLLMAADIAIVVDAVISGGAPGTVLRLSGRSLPSFVNAGLSSHGMRLQTLLELVKTLGNSPSDLIIYGIESADVDAEMSQDVLRAVSFVVDRIKGDIVHFS